VKVVALLGLCVLQVSAPSKGYDYLQYVVWSEAQEQHTHWPVMQWSSREAVLLAHDIVHRRRTRACEISGRGHARYQGDQGKLESRPTVTRLSLGCLILVRSLI